MVTVMVQNVCHDGDSAETFLQLGRKADVPSLHAETSSPESEWFSSTLNLRLFVKRTDFQQLSKSALVE
jgi:hypothetical protein